MKRVTQRADALDGRLPIQHGPWTQRAAIQTSQHFWLTEEEHLLNASSDGQSPPEPRLVRIDVNEFGWFTITVELYRHIESHIPARFRQSPDGDDTRGQLGMHRLVEPEKDGCRTLRVRNYAELADRWSRAGIEVQFTFPALKFSSVAFLEGVRNPVVQRLIEDATLTDHRYGQLDFETPDKAVEIVADLARAFPEARIVVPVNRAVQRKWLRRRLRAVLGERVGLMRGTTPVADARVCLATARAARAVDAVAGAVVLMPFFDDWTPDWTRRLQVEGYAGRVYFIRPRNRRHPKLEREWILRYGVMLSGIAGPEHKFVMVNFESNGCMKNVLACPHTNRKEAIWRHDERNDRIARLAEACSDALPPSNEAISRVGVVVVENLEHARELRRQLPGWRTIGRDDSVGPTDRCLIATLPAMEGVSLRPRWVINAMGGWPSGPFESLVFGLADVPTPVFLIDLMDRFGSSVRAMSRARRSSYQDAGFQQVKLQLRLDSPNPRQAGRQISVVDVVGRNKSPRR